MSDGRVATGQDDRNTLVKWVMRNEVKGEQLGQLLQTVFLGAEKHLEKRVCPSVPRSVTPFQFRRYRYRGAKCLEAPRGLFWFLAFD